MNGRLLMLLLATGLFISAWNSANQPAPASHSARVVGWTAPASSLPNKHSQDNPAHLANVSESAHQAHSSTGFMKTVAAIQPPGRSNDMALPVWTARDCPAPLPEGMAPGRYQVVSSAGKMGTLELTERDGCQSEPLAAESETDGELFIAVTGTTRWYFIRLSTADVPRVSAITMEPIDSRQIRIHPLIRTWIEVATSETLHWCKNHLQDRRSEPSPTPGRFELGVTDFQSIQEPSGNSLESSEALELDLAPLPPEAG